MLRETLNQFIQVTLSQEARKSDGVCITLWLLKQIKDGAATDEKPASKEKIRVLTSPHRTISQGVQELAPGQDAGPSH